MQNIEQLLKTTKNFEDLPFKQKLDKFINASISQVHIAEELCCEVYQAPHAQHARRARASASKQQLLAGGLYIVIRYHRFHRSGKNMMKRKNSTPEKWRDGADQNLQEKCIKWMSFLI